MSHFFQTLMSGLDDVEHFLAGEREGFQVTVPDAVDVRRIRTSLGMTQARFSQTFGFPIDTLKHWEGGRRNPESSARAFLTVIARDPVAVLSALKPAAEKKVRAAVRKKVTVRRAA